MTQRRDLATRSSSRRGPIAADSAARMTVVEHAPEGDRAVRVDATGSFVVEPGTAGDRHLAPEIHARAIALLTRVRQFTPAAFSVRDGEPTIELRWQVGAGSVHRASFSAGGRCPDAAWELVTLLGALDGPQHFGVPDGGRSL